MRRNLSSALIAAVAIPAAATSQETSDIARMLAFVHRECPVALNDPQAFMAKFPQATSTGAPTVSVSPDQAIFHLEAMLEDFAVSADWSNHGAWTMRHCAVTVGQTAAPADETDRQLRDWYRDNLSLELNGGTFPISYSDGAGGSYSPDHYARYIVNDAIVSPLGPTFTSIEISDGYIGLSVSVVHPTVTPND